MFLKSKWFQLGVAAVLCIIVLLLPRPEGTKFTIKGDDNQVFLQHIKEKFKLVNSVNSSTEEYMVEVKSPENFKSPGIYLRETAERLKLKDLRIDYVDGLSPKAKRFLAVLAMLVFFSVVTLWIVSIRQPLPATVRNGLHGLLAAALLQVTLGISTLLLHVPIPLAVAHQGGALLLLTVVIYVRHRMLYTAPAS